MTILTSIILVVAITAIALFIAYNVQKGTKTLQEFKDDYYDNEEAQEVVELAKELYNKDLRPVTVKKAPKKEKVTSENITPEVIEKVVEIAKVTPEPTTVNVEVVLEQLKKEVSTTTLEAVVEAPKTVEAVVEPTKPKKKRKYYPKAPKGKS